MLNSNDPEVVEFAYQYLHTNSEASLLYPPDDAVKNLLRMSSYVDQRQPRRRSVAARRARHETISVRDPVILAQSQGRRPLSKC
jgi:hypothetical protein